MSDRLAWSLLLVLGIVAAPLHAQQELERLERLERLDRRERALEARLADLQAHAAERGEREFAAQPRVVISAGPLHVAYPAWAASEARDLLPRLYAERKARYGTALETLLHDTLVIWVEDSAQLDGRWTARGQWRLGARHDSLNIDLAPDLRTDWMTSTVRLALEQWGQGLLDPALVRWTGPTGPRVDVNELRDGAIRDLMTSPSSRARRCLDGAADECGRVLGFDLGTDSLVGWYDPSDLPPLVANIWTATRLPGSTKCIVRREIASCVALIQRYHLSLAHPISGRVRQSLFSFALATGGEGAWTRLHEAAGRPVGDQLAAAAQRPVDELLTAWQRDLRGEHRTTSAGLSDALFLAFVWSIVGTLFFAWRYRWRHV